MQGAGWGTDPDAKLSERDPILGADERTRRKGRRMPLGALALALLGLAVGLSGTLTVDAGGTMLELGATAGYARLGFGIAILAGAWIAFGHRDRAGGARVVGVAIMITSLVALFTTS